MANEFVIKNGYFSQGNSNVTGSLRVSSSIGVVGSGSDVLSVYGSQGNLLVVTDSMSGSLFTISDISGYPILDVTSDYYTSSVFLPTLTNLSQVNAVVIDTASGQLYYLPTSSIGGGSGTPGGSNKQIQFNANGAFSGSSNFTFDSSSNTLTLTGSLNTSGSTIINGSDLTTQPFSSLISIPTQIAGNTGIRGNLYVYPKSDVTSSVVFGGGGYSSWTLQSLAYSYFQIRSTPNEGGTPGPPTTLMHFSSGSNGEFRIGVLNETPEYTFDISGSARVTGSFYLPGLITSSQLNVVVIDTASGQLYYTASSAIGGGGASTSSLIGNGAATTWNINHGFNTRNLHITVYESSSNGETVYPDIRRINENTASIIFANPPTTNQYIVYISQ
jgi:hypothetical protein